MNKLLTMAAIVGALTTAGCATPYHDLGVLGGIQARRVDEHRAYVSMKGNLFTNSQTAHTYVLRRSAELTMASGYKTFEIVAVEGGQKTEWFFPGFGHVSGNRNGANAVSMTSAFQGSYPDMTVQIFMSNDPVPPTEDSRMYDAAEVLKYAATPPAR